MMNSWNFSFALGSTPVLVEDTSGTISTSSTYVGYIGNYNYYMSCNSSDVYASFVYNGSSIWLFMASPNSGVTGYAMKRDSFNNVTDSANLTSSLNGFYYAPIFGTFSEYALNNSSSSLPYYSSVEDFISAVSGVYVPPQTYPIGFDNGYLLVLDLAASGTSFSFDLTSTSDVKSDWLTGKFPYANQSYWFSSQLPDSNSVIPPSNATLISWSKDSTKPDDWLGRSYYMASTLSGTSSARYLYIYNPPLHMGANSNQTNARVPNKRMVVNGLYEGYVNGSYLYNTSGVLSLTNVGNIRGTVDIDDSGYFVVSSGAVHVYQLTTSGGSIVPTDDPYIQTVGGNTDMSDLGYASLEENISGINDILNNFVSTITNLFSVPISHIQQLIESGQSFFQVFIHIFDWLPVELSSLIQSALVVMIIIGVIKMLL